MDTSIEATPGVALRRGRPPRRRAAAKRSPWHGPALEFLKDQYRHCKTILAVGGGAGVLRAAGIPDALPDGQPDPGLLAGEAGEATVDVFLSALAKHRHFERETDPPRV